MNQEIKKSLLHTLICSLMLPMAAFAAEGEHKLELKARGVYWNDESLAYPSTATPNPRSTSYEQSALGVQLNYASPYWGSFIGFDASLYGVAKLDSSGTPTSNLLDVGNSGRLENSYATAGQALVKFKYGDLFQIKLGRQLQTSLLLKSTDTRAVPDTYSGVSAIVKPMNGLSIYGAVYDKWRARSTGEFEEFRTEATAAGVANTIDYISILGSSYTNGPWLITAEYLNSRSYLSKFGLYSAYTIPLDKTTFKVSGGLFTSNDAGSLFVCTAEREMDCAGTSRISNDGLGAYIDGEWKVNNFTLGSAIAKFDGLWIEDNFAVNATRNGSLTQDHGSTPFPTSAGLGPDFSNRDELVGSFRLAYDFKEYIPGLRAGYKYVRGTGAKSSNRDNAARGSENYRELSVQYAIPFVKNLSARYAYMNYDSHVENGSTTATIRGMPRRDWEQHRFYIDYSYQF